MAKEPESWRQKGEEDASNGDKKPPHDRMPIVGDLVAPLTKEQREERADYFQGQKDWHKKTGK